MTVLPEMSDDELVRMLRFIASPIVAELLRRGDLELRVDSESADGLVLCAILKPNAGGSTSTH